MVKLIVLAAVVAVLIVLIAEDVNGSGKHRSSESGSSENGGGGIVRGHWSKWSSWSGCSNSCGHGQRTRTRSCVAPKSYHHSRYAVVKCSHGSATDKKSCRGDDCKVNGRWTSWGQYTDCSASCGGGTRTRDRTCTNPSPSNGGRDCRGDKWESKKCNTQSCKVNGRWTSWGQYTDCSASCGGGTRSRDRTCTNPSPSNGGRDCRGDKWESKKCNTQSCKVNGRWTSWGQYTDCSASCGGGTRSRDRTCTNPSPSNGGRDCKGDKWESKKCNTQSCKVNGGWTEWGQYSDCSVTCGTGTRTRDRTCTHPVPSNGGKDCKGDAWETKKCYNAKCKSYYH